MIRIIPRQSFPYMIVTMILGTLNHFLYDWSGKNPVIALFTPVNESVWEHMKLLFFPFLLLSLIEYIIHRPDSSRFFGSRLFAVWCGMFSIIMLFYGYSGAIGRSLMLIDILLYYLGVIITYSLSANTERLFHGTSILTIFLWWAGSTLLLFFFTCFPPEIPLFISA